MYGKLIDSTKGGAALEKTAKVKLVVDQKLPDSIDSKENPGECPMSEGGNFECNFTVEKFIVYDSKLLIDKTQSDQHGEFHSGKLSMENNYII